MKKLFALLILSGASLLFAGCGAAAGTNALGQSTGVPDINTQTQTANNSLQYADTSLTTTASGSTASTTATKAASPVTPTKPPTGPLVKTLKDFSPITATEATLHTNQGDIVIQLYPDKAPITVTNFLTLAKAKFYDGIKFHRIIAGFMAQVGDPLTKDDAQQPMWGTGGPGYTIPDEFAPDLQFDGPGVVAMANTGAPSTGGSQFFITFDQTSWLNGKHAIFGHVTKGMDVVNKLVIGDQIQSISYK